MAEIIKEKDALKSYTEDMIIYSIVVNRRRSLPEIRDGQKPVQRRLLYDMFEDGNPLKLRKSASITGDCMGKYHPHGNCLQADTKIFELNGNIRTIAEVYKDGKSIEVLAIDPVTHNIVPAIAHSFRIGQFAEKIYHIQLSNGSEIKCTEEHPILNSDYNYKLAKDLKVGDKIYAMYNNKNTNIEICNIFVEYTEQVPMYDFTVDKYENMLISTNDNIFICIHNSAIYSAMRPLVNPWECKLPIIYGHGNWGSIAEDDPAAERYTEAKLTPFGYDCVIGELKDSKNSVDWINNFDDTKQEPEYLPAKVPVLLINGCSGIAVGIVVDIPTHNLVEVLNVTKLLMKDPMADFTLIPDHCQCCDIIESDWKEIAETGNGSYRVRGHVEIGEHHKYPAIFVKSLPNGVNTTAIYQRINGMISNKELPMVREVIDANNNNIINVLIQLQKGADVNYVKEILYKKTDLEKSYSVWMNVVDGIEPKLMSYREYLLGFIEQRKITKFRTYCNRMQDVRTRLHQLETYIQVLESGEIDNIINMIKKRKDTDDAPIVEYIIKKLNFTDLQANFIIHSDLRKLSIGFLNKYKEEVKELKAKNKMMEEYIIDDSKIIEEISNELDDIAKRYGSPRLCKVVKAKDASNIPRGQFKIVISENNYIRKLSIDDKASAVKGDIPKHILIADNQESILLFDDKGKVFKLPVHKIPLTEKGTNGCDIRMIIKGLTANIAAVLYEPTVKKVSEIKGAKHFITVVTEGNYIKKLDIDDFLNVPLSGIIYTKLVSSNDRVVDIQITPDNLDLIIYSGHKALRVPMSEVPNYKRASQGVLAMNTKESIGGISVVYPNATHIIVVTASGRVNKFSISGLDKSVRNKGGSSVIKLGKTDKILSIHGVNDDNVISVITRAGREVYKVKDFDTLSSVSSGVKLASSKGDNMIIKVEVGLDQ